MHNLLPRNSINDGTSSSGSATLLGHSLDKVINRLDTMLMVLKSCQGASCVNPWSVLHPDGGVETLKDALQPHFDTFYIAQPKVEFSRCEEGYIIDAEGPQLPSIYGQGQMWPAWT